MRFLFVDSGTGGLPYMLELLKKAPGAECVYVGDTANFPYGEKSLSHIEQCATLMIEKAINRFAPDVIVIACNTISVAALASLRSRFTVPFVGTVPAIKLASKVSKKRCIGLLATRHTVEDPYTLDLINRFAADCTVIKRGDAKLISFIEHNLFRATYEQKCDAVREAVDFFTANGTDTIVLACTHFLHLVKEFEDVAGSAITVVDSREGVARQALRVGSSLGADMARTDTLQASAKAPYNKESAHGVYVTALKSKSDEEEYKTWCTLYGVPFKGLL